MEPHNPLGGLTSKTNYEEIYTLQDKVLDLVFSVEKEFYLTGGTCLSRFYQAKRYSDDLDFFTNDSLRFHTAVRTIIAALQNTYDVDVGVTEKNFIRIKAEQLLQIDFVNDSAYRHGESILTQNNYVIDNPENILANKLTAVIGRDDPKDVFDVLLISKYCDVSWHNVIAAAHKKAWFSNEELIIRLKSFPETLLNQIHCIDCSFLDTYAADMDTIISILLKA